MLSEPMRRTIHGLEVATYSPVEAEAAITAVQMARQSQQQPSDMVEIASQLIIVREGFSLADIPNDTSSRDDFERAVKVAVIAALGDAVGTSDIVIDSISSQRRQLQGGNRITLWFHVEISIDVAPQVASLMHTRAQMGTPIDIWFNGVKIAADA